MLSSRTEPQLVHTALPRAWSTSMSAPPQVLHSLELIVLKGHTTSGAGYLHKFRNMTEITLHSLISN